jgi:CRP-like cAMP-binding protein
MIAASEARPDARRGGARSGEALLIGEAELAHVLAQVDFLQNETMSALQQLMTLATPHTYPKGNLLFCHGDAASAVYVVLSGRVKVSLLSEEGREVILAVIRPAELMGLDAALDDGRNFGTATTVTRCRLARIDRNAFLDWLQDHPTAQRGLLGELSRRLHFAWEKIGEQALLPVKRRLLMTLIELARQDGTSEAGEAGGPVTFVRPTHQELAELIGSSRVVVSRILKELLEEEDAFAAEGNVIRVYLDDLVLVDDFGGDGGDV